MSNIKIKEVLLAPTEKAKTLVASDLNKTTTTETEIKNEFARFRTLVDNEDGAPKNE
jgi:hypothetical protein